MKIQLKKSKLKGEINIVPSKSYAHRLIFASALTGKHCEISNVDLSEDIKATLSCIKNFGIDYIYDDINRIVKFNNNDNKSITDINKYQTEVPIFDCNESGSTLRMFLPIALTKYKHFIIKGKEKLIERGISVYEDILNDVKFIKNKNEIEVIGELKPGIYNLPGNISSQYISGLLFALPLLNNDSIVNITTELESKNYIDITIDVLKKSNIDIVENDADLKQAENGEKIYHSYTISGNQKYNIDNSIVEGDYSNAAFIDAFNYLGSDIKINGLNINSKQGDKIYKNIFEILNNENATIDISNCIDLGPVLFAFSSLKHGAKFVGTKRLKIKESDRGVAMREELSKFGVEMVIDDDSIVVIKSELHPPVTTISSHNDHRIIMSMSLFMSRFDITIDGAEAVNKSYPNFYRDLESSGANIIYE